MGDYSSINAEADSQKSSRDSQANSNASGRSGAADRISNAMTGESGGIVGDVQRASKKRALQRASQSGR